MSDFIRGQASSLVNELMQLISNKVAANNNATDAADASRRAAEAASRASEAALKAQKSCDKITEEEKRILLLLQRQVDLEYALNEWKRAPDDNSASISTREKKKRRVIQIESDDDTESDSTPPRSPSISSFTHYSEDEKEETREEKEGNDDEVEDTARDAHLRMEKMAFIHSRLKDQYGMFTHTHTHIFIYIDRSARYTADLCQALLKLDTQRLGWGYCTPSQEELDQMELEVADLIGEKVM